MKVRFRGGIYHNKSRDFSKLESNVFFVEPILLDYNSIDWDDINKRDFSTEYIRHRYQLGKDKNGTQFYFYIGV